MRGAIVELEICLAPRQIHGINNWSILSVSLNLLLFSNVSRAKKPTEGLAMQSHCLIPAIIQTLYELYIYI